MSCDSSSIVRLNIGGKKFCTTIDTLTHREPDSMLAAMFSGRHTVCKDPQTGYIFVDRDGTHFRHILNWLRDGIVPTLMESDYAELMREAEYFQLLGLIEGLNATLCKRKDEDELDSELTRRDIIKCIHSEKVKFRGVNLSGLDLSKLDLSFVDFSHACLKGVFFSRANLQCAKFKDVDAEGSIFHNATLRKDLEEPKVLNGCEFTGANLRGALLAGANLQSANLQDACLIDCSFCGADLRSAHLQDEDCTHLFFQCGYSKRCLDGISKWLHIVVSPIRWRKMRSVRSLSGLQRNICSAAVNGLVYWLWTQRNVCRVEGVLLRPEILVHQLRRLVLLRLDCLDLKNVKISDRMWLERIKDYRPPL